MKKILLIIPALLCLILSSLPLAAVHAEDEKYITLDEFMANEKFKDAAERKYYFYFTYDYKHPTSDVWYNRTCVISTSSDTLSVTEENGVYTISTTNGSMYLNYYEKRNGSSNGINYTNNSTCNKFVYDSNTNTLSSDSKYFTDNPWTVGNVQTNMFKADSNELDIDITFTPSLSGSCNFTHTITNDVPPLNSSGKPWETEPTSEGAKYEHTIQSNNFSIDVRNNSKFGVQILMAIVPEGGSLSFNYDVQNNPTGVASVYDTSSNPLFVWWSEEWNYFYNSTISYRDGHYLESGIDWGSQFTCSKQLSNIPWHFVGGKSSISHDFALNQMKIQQDVKYDVLVYAVKCDYSCASRQCAFENSPYYVDYSSIQLVYSSNFSIPFSVQFDANNTFGGNVVFTNPQEALIEGWKSKGYIDPVTGETVIQSKDFNAYSEEHKKITGEVYKDVLDNSWAIQSSGGSSSGSFNNLLSNTKSFFSFIKTVLGYFPSSVLTVFDLALWAILIFALIRRIH